MDRIWILSMPKSVARNKVAPARGSGQNIKKFDLGGTIMKKRFLAGLLMLAMILTLLPVSALAADTGSQPASTTLRMKVGETRSIQ